MAEQQEPQEETDAPPRIRVKGSDGQWRELRVEPKETGDPELDQLWRMSLGEVERIAADAQHPLHEKALQVQREAVEPIAEAMAEATRPIANTLKSITDAFAKSIDTSRFTELGRNIGVTTFPRIDTSSWISPLLPKLQDLEPSLAALGHDVVPLAEGLSDSEIPEIDFDAVEPPDASLAAVARASEERAHEIRTQQAELLAELVRQAKVDSVTADETLAVTKQSKAAAWVAAWAAVVAAVIAAVGIFVTIVLSS